MNKCTYYINLFLIIFFNSVLILSLDVKEDLTLLFGILLLFVQIKSLNYVKNDKKSFKLFILIYSVIFSIFMTLSRQLESITEHNIQIINEYIYYIFTFLAITYSLNLSLTAIFKYMKIKTNNLYINNKKLTIKKFMLLWISLIILWLPYFIILFPGVMSYDSLNQFGQAITSTYTNHHPIISSLLVKFSTLFFGESNLSVALYSFIQMLILSLIFTYFIAVISKTNINKKLLIIFLLYFGLFNIHPIYSITMWKDVLYGGFILLLCTHMININLCDRKLNKTINIIVLVISILSVCLFRSNGLYVLVALIPFIFIIYFKDKKIIILFTLSVMLAILIKYPMLDILNIKQCNFSEQIGIPLNQVSSIIYEGHELEDKDLEIIENILPKDDIKEVFNSTNVNYIKFHEDFNNEYLKKNKLEFIKLWIKLGIKYPRTYLRTYFSNTKYFFNIFSPIENGYYYGIESNNYNLYSINKDTKVYNLLQNFNKFIQSVIILKPLYSYAFLAWLLIFAITINLYKKNYKIVSILMIPFLNWCIIMLATPLAMEKRYIYSLYTTLPIIIISIIYNINKGELKWITEKK